MATDRGKGARRGEPFARARYKLSTPGGSQVRFRPASLSVPLRDRSWDGRPVDLVARRDLQRYYTLLDLSLDRVVLSESEAGLVCHALNWLQQASPDEVEIDHWQVAWADVADAIRRERLDQQWNVDGEELIQRLRRLSPGELAAIVDAAERFWINYQQQEPAATKTIAEQLRDVGLLRNSRPRRRH